LENSLACSVPRVIRIATSQFGGDALGNQTGFQKIFLRLDRQPMDKPGTAGRRWMRGKLGGDCPQEV
jgi:hypothetical protein